MCRRRRIGILQRALKWKRAAALVRRDGPKCLPAGERRGRKGALGPERGEKRPFLGPWSDPLGNDKHTFTRGESWIRRTCERWCGQPHLHRHYGTRVSITEDAPVRRRPSSAPARRAWRHGGAWSRPAALVLLAVAAALAIWWLATRETRTTSYRVLGDLAGIRLDLGDADVEIDGGAAAVEVRRVDQFAFGQPPRSTAPSPPAAHHRLALPGPGARRVSARLPADRARQRAARDRDRRAARCALSGVRASVQVSTGSGPISATGFCGFSCAPRRTPAT